MKASSVALDRVLHRILMEEEVGAFTIMELRDRYLKYVDQNDVSMPRLRVYIYEQIRRLVNYGWASYYGEKKARGQRFVMKPKPENLSVKLLHPGQNMQERAEDESGNAGKVRPDAIQAASQLGEVSPSPAYTLKQMLKETRLDLLTSYGETERYAQMIEAIPSLQGTLEQDLIASRDKSSRLLGHVNALETALQKIGVM